MAAIKYKAQVDEEGNVVLPAAGIAPGTTVSIRAILSAEDGSIELLIETADNELRSTVIQDADARCEELRAVSLGTMDFWDNPIDNEIWG